ncbi:HlyD family efflux transporter periplasmic adaptor subunit [Streptomyces sp. ME03-5709C]|nr:HlyD family efflux transporter periplasmic adaptor subunit [Streptomyces sp. ME03-5709C]
MAASRAVRTARRTDRRALTVAAVLLVTGGMAYGGHSLTSGAEQPAASAGKVARPSTVTVVRTDLADTQTHRGTLGYGSDIAVKGAGEGTVTELPPTGRTVKRGRQLYAVDDRPAVVFYGTTPLYRTLDKPTLRGRDVTMVAENLEALGYDIGPRVGATVRGNTGTGGGRAGDVYTKSLSDAVKRWQGHVGMDPTGTLEVGQIVVVPGPVRVSSVQAQLGDPVAEPLMTVTRTSKSVSVPVQATDTDGISTGAKVVITLPDDREVPGTVTSISQTVQGGGNAPDGQNSPPTLLVTVTPAAAPKYDAASVQVRFTSSTRKDVLAVPVGALVALSGGGYALQKTDGTYLAVETGLYADGMVEVRGDGVSEGVRVEAAS